MLRFGAFIVVKKLKVNKLLIIQTAFIGDVILATSQIEMANKMYPEAEIHFLLRRGNESLLKDNPKVSKVWIWEKKNNKTLNLLKLILDIRKENFDLIYNIQRFFSSGLLVALSKAKKKIGFHNNPLSFLFDIKIRHEIPYFYKETYLHEVQRNNLLLFEKNDEDLALNDLIRPKLYFNSSEEEKIKKITENLNDYLVLAPSSVWFTKQWAKEKWQELTKVLSKNHPMLFIGAPSDEAFVKEIIGENSNTINLCGKLSLKESALLMRNAKRVFVNDSAPLHLASSVNAKTTAIFNSTIPEFGYGPLSENSKVVQLSPRLECMPCGLHGKKQCPLGHFHCAFGITIDEVIRTID